MLDGIFTRHVAVRVYGLGAVALGVTGLAWGDFAVVWQPPSISAPGQSPWGYVVAAAPLLAGLAMQWQRIAVIGAMALLVGYCVAIVFFDLPRGLAHPSAFLAWYGVLENLALAVGALIICTQDARLQSGSAERLSKCGRVVFGICLIYFGLAHHVALANTVGMVPAWLPPSQIFWAYATAAGHIAAGIAIISGFLARPAAMLLTAMFVVFTVLVHVPTVIAAPHNHFAWGENAVNLALIGSAWVVAASVPAAAKIRAKLS